MISSLQPNRPRITQPAHSSAPMNQQPIRKISSFTPPPRSQIEAMPPVPFLLPLSQLQRPSQIALNPSIRHPVFFTPRLQRAPNGVETGSLAWGSPIASGYVYNDGVRRETQTRL